MKSGCAAHNQRGCSENKSRKGHRHMYLRRMAAVLLSVRQKPNSPGAVSDTVSIRLVTMCNSCSDQSVGSKKEGGTVPSHRPNSLHAFHGTWLVTPVTDDPGVPKRKVPPAQAGTAVPYLPPSTLPWWGPQAHSFRSPEQRGCPSQAALAHSSGGSRLVTD